MSAAVNKKPADLSETQFAHINNVLDDLDIIEEIETVTSDVTLEGASEEEDVIEEVVIDAGGKQTDEIEDLDFIQEIVAGVQRDESRKQAYADQESSTPAPDLTNVQTSSDGTKTVKKNATATKTPKTPRAPKQPSAPRAARDISSVPDEFFFLKSGMGPADDAASARVNTMALMPAQKKIAEKFENLFIGLNSGGRISTFTVDAFALLKKSGSFTSSDLVASYKADGYDEGTARSQCGQIMNLFNVLQIAKRDGNKLELNPESSLAERLDDWIAKKATPAAP